MSKLNFQQPSFICMYMYHNSRPFVRTLMSSFVFWCRSWIPCWLWLWCRSWTLQFTHLSKSAILTSRKYWATYWSCICDCDTTCYVIVWFNVISRPLRRMTVGMLLAALAFVAAALLQIQIDVSIKQILCNLADMLQ